MQDFSSFLIVIALWLGSSVGLWWLHRQNLRSKRRRQREFVAQVWTKVRAAQDAYDSIRQNASSAPQRPLRSDRAANGDVADASDNGEAGVAILRAQTTALLRRVQEAGPFFDDVRALHPELQRVLQIESCPPLSEILQIRRDLWAASEIILIDDVNALGDAFAEHGSYDRFCEDARRLLFKGEAEAAGEDDLIDLRLSVARSDVEMFATAVEQDIHAAEERERLPTPTEIISYPVAAARALPGQIRVFRVYVSESIDDIRLAARNVRQSQTVADALSELRRAREELPDKLGASMEKAAALARHGRESIAAHHRVLTKAYDLQAKYQEALQKAPELSERGRQFVARLELARRSEQLRETSKGILDDGKRKMVRYLAHAIAGLQRLQEMLAVPEPATVGAMAGQRQGLPRGHDRQIERVSPPNPASTASPKLAPKAATRSKTEPAMVIAKTDRAPPNPAPEVSTKAVAAKAAAVVHQTVDETPNPQTLKRLDTLFGRRHAGSRKKEAITIVELPPAVAATPARDEQSPPKDAAASLTPAARTPSQVTSPEPQRAPIKRSLWPALDKIRQDAVAPPPKTEPAPPPKSKQKPTAIKAAEPVIPSKPVLNDQSQSRLKSIFGGRKKPAPAEIIPPTKPANQRAARTETQPDPAPDDGSIATMLARLRLADAEIVDAERDEPVDSAPQARRRKAPSLLSKLSSVGESQFDLAAAGSTQTEADAQPSAAAEAPPAIDNAATGARKRGGFSLFRGKKA